MSILFASAYILWSADGDTQVNALGQAPWTASSAQWNPPFSVAFQEFVGALAGNPAHVVVPEVAAQALPPNTPWDRMAGFRMERASHLGFRVVDGDLRTFCEFDFQIEWEAHGSRGGKGKYIANALMSPVSAVVPFPNTMDVRLHFGKPSYVGRVDDAVAALPVHGHARCLGGRRMQGMYMAGHIFGNGTFDFRPHRLDSHARNVSELYGKLLFGPASAFDGAPAHIRGANFTVDNLGSHLTFRPTPPATGESSSAFRSMVLHRGRNEHVAVNNGARRLDWMDDAADLVANYGSTFWHAVRGTIDVTTSSDYANGLPHPAPAWNEMSSFVRDTCSCGGREFALAAHNGFGMEACGVHFHYSCYIQGKYKVEGNYIDQLTVPISYTNNAWLHNMRVHIEIPEAVNVGTEDDVEAEITTRVTMECSNLLAKSTSHQVVYVRGSEGCLETPCWSA